MAGIKRRLCILGATGSVGQAALAVVREHSDLYQAAVLVAGGNVETMAALCREFRPQRAVLADAVCAEALAQALTGEGIAVDGGQSAVLSAATDAGVCTVVAAIAGAAGVDSALAAADAGKRLLVANKEALIVAGELMLRAVETSGGELLPVDSEHCALYELLAHDGDFKKLWLTASGGSVRNIPLSALDEVTPEVALQHPNWSMGKKITVDSATMMNKGLEILEAAVLFRADANSVGVVIHPQSIFHALVEYPDGSMTAALSRPDMRLPLARMLAWPARLPAVQTPPDWRDLSASSFTPPDARRYPCLSLAYQALAAGGAYPAALSAANEVAVARFLAGELRFTDIARINATVLNDLSDPAAATIETVRHAEQTARRLAAQPLSL